MSRVRLLALLLVVLGGSAVALAAMAEPGARWPARLALLFALPFAASIAASLLLPRERNRAGDSARVAGTGKFHTVLAAAVLLDLSTIGIGYLSGWATFTHGDQALRAHELLAVPLALPFTIAAATLGSEWALRARLWETARRLGRSREGALLSIVAGTALALPAIAPGFSSADGLFLVSALAVALAREASSLVLFRHGGLLVAGAYRGTLTALEAFGLGDGHGFFVPVATYLANEPLFYLLRALGPLAALLVVARAGRRA